jgi:regulatory protein
VPPRPASVKVRALQWLAQREHSRIELRDKLLRLLSRSAARRPDAVDQGQAEPADPATEVEALLQWLESHGYLSQQRFAESRVHARQAKFGNLRIQQELQQHGVKLDPEAKQALKESELQRALEVWSKKYSAPAPDAAGRMKQARFLAGRGFSMAVVRQVIRVGTRGGDAEDAPDLVDL